MNRLLITGGAGFIGVNFVYYWLRQHPEDVVIVLDKLTYAGSLESLNSANKHSKYKFYQGDIGDIALVSSILRQYKINIVVNFAAESHVDRSIVAPDAFIQTNVVGVHALLSACKEYWVESGEFSSAHRFHQISTDEVYGSLTADEAAFTESTLYRPNSPYSASKAASDHLVRAYHHTYGLNVSTSNCSNNYGPFHFPEKLIPLCITRLLLGGAIPVYGDGMNIRDWLYVEDHCRGIELILEKGCVGHTYNIGGNNEWDNLALVKSLCKIMQDKALSGVIDKTRFPNSAVYKESGAEGAIEFVEDRLGHDRRYAVDAHKISVELGYKPKVSIEEGLNRTIDWYLENESWWRPLLERARL